MREVLMFLPKKGRKDEGNLGGKVGTSTLVAAQLIREYTIYGSMSVQKSENESAIACMPIFQSDKRDFIRAEVGNRDVGICSVLQFREHPIPKLGCGELHVAPLRVWISRPNSLSGDFVTMSCQEYSRVRRHQLPPASNPAS
jgi:hypothetical protein